MLSHDVWQHTYISDAIKAPDKKTTKEDNEENNDNNNEKKSRKNEEQSQIVTLCCKRHVFMCGQIMWTNKNQV